MADRSRTLFVRLLIYFLIVLLLPLLVFSGYYLFLGDRSQSKYLSEQSLGVIRRDALIVGNVLEEYRHKAYLLSTDELIVEVMKHDSPEFLNRVIHEVYPLLFSVMKGDTYLASANLVSNTGRIRLSTHAFPKMFDLRYHTSTSELNSVIAQNLNLSQTASLITTRGHRTAENGRQVVASILRRIYDGEGTNLGYLVIDLFGEALSTGINSERLFSDLYLIDQKEFHATSLIHTDMHGSFDKFPPLLSLKGDYTPRSVQVGSTVVAVAPVANTTNLYLAGTLSTVFFSRNISRWYLVFTGTLIAGFALAMMFSFLFSRSIAHPIASLARRMDRVDRMNLETRPVKSTITEFAQLENSYNMMIDQIRTLLEQTREEQKKLSEAERKALESQMNPHFLFNTLNTIKALARINNQEEIYTITVKLGKLLRSTIDSHESEATLAHSIALIDSYLTIQKLRYGEKLVTSIHLDPACAHIKTPKLIIQPLVENAIIHGLEPKVGNWFLAVRVEAVGRHIQITVEDNGVGFDRATLPQDLNDLAHSTHVGLYNVYRRLSLAYQNELEFSIDSTVGKGTIVRISLPIGRR
ncbi:MAG TPA: sensor histidine kinase [Sphaerochaeta sp.]|jgi:two-component system sensor histidine kinase YesM|nr:sensor histidine kinase [Sphaerochaeta sp.]HPB42505.1 sensor histidine kinase [Sphaerochaeta sp.]HPY45579.1 sensor histidine kinase [Sphaerochaeta sp.]HQB05210.1 sensor histidine kinase [Sphaerochaeta sp.]